MKIWMRSARRRDLSSHAGQHTGHRPKGSRTVILRPVPEKEQNRREDPLSRSAHCMIGHGLLIGLLWMTAGCAATDASVSPTPRSTEFQEGQILDTANGQSISLEQLVSHLLQQDVIYLGEEHHNR